MFDGVHLGHQHVIRQALLDARASGARSAVVTFDPHPLAVVAPDRAPKLLQSVAERVRIIGELGADAVVLMPFGVETSRVPGEEFVRELARRFGRLRSFTVGSGFQFGHGRSGDVPLLQRLGSELGFVVHATAPIRIGDDVVSSTRIRAALRAGQLGLVAELLGRPYTIAGPVLSGDRLGRQLGFPTANLDVAGLELPPLGVYAVRVRHRDQEWLGALNIGRRPTVAGQEAPVRCEVHLLDFHEEIYGQELRIEFTTHLRPEIRFSDLSALRSQIASDIDLVRQMLE